MKCAATVTRTDESGDVRAPCGAPATHVAHYTQSPPRPMCAACAALPRAAGVRVKKIRPTP